jgi:uncharacterized membrane-anchored protein
MPVRNIKSNSEQIGFNKVPQITAWFWVIKILTTAMGEATSDALVNALGPAIAVPLAFFVFIFALRLQFKSNKYTPKVYWFAVAMVAVFGTMAADGVHIAGLPYPISSTMYAIILAAIFYKWYKSQGTLSIHSIYNLKREQFYWLTVLATFALGTAVGDLTATNFNLGFLKSGIMFAVIILIPAATYYFTKTKEIFFFWFAYVLTRPLGASFADWFGKPKSIGGLNLQDYRVSIVLTIIIVMIVSQMQRTYKPQKD